jgi:hypothetical protein
VDTIAAWGAVHAAQLLRRVPEAVRIDRCGEVVVWEIVTIDEKAGYPLDQLVRRLAGDPCAYITVDALRPA